MPILWSWLNSSDSTIFLAEAQLNITPNDILAQTAGATISNLNNLELNIVVNDIIALATINMPLTEANLTVFSNTANILAQNNISISEALIQISSLNITYNSGPVSYTLQESKIDSIANDLTAQNSIFGPVSLDITELNYITNDLSANYIPVSVESNWITNLQASLYIALSGYLVSTGYLINNESNSNNINLLMGFPDDLRRITDTSITLDEISTTAMTKRNQIAGSGWDYNLQVQCNIFGKSDREIQILMYDVMNYTRDVYKYYNWAISVTEGLTAGETIELIDIDQVNGKIVRPDKFETNDYLNHRGLVTIEATMSSDDIL